MKIFTPELQAHSFLSHLINSKLVAYSKHAALTPEHILCLNMTDAAKAALRQHFPQAKIKSLNFDNFQHANFMLADGSVDLLLANLTIATDLELMQVLKIASRVLKRDDLFVFAAWDHAGKSYLRKHAKRIKHQKIIDEIAVGEELDEIDTLQFVSYKELVLRGKHRDEYIACHIFVGRPEGENELQYTFDRAEQEEIAAEKISEEIEEMNEIIAEEEEFDDVAAEIEIENLDADEHEIVNAASESREEDNESSDNTDEIEEWIEDEFSNEETIELTADEATTEEIIQEAEEIAAGDIEVAGVEEKDIESDSDSESDSESESDTEIDIDGGEDEEFDTENADEAAESDEEDFDSDVDDDEEDQDDEFADDAEDEFSEDEEDFDDAEACEVDEDVEYTEEDEVETDESNDFASRDEESDAENDTQKENQQETDTQITEDADTEEAKESVERLSREFNVR